MENNFYVGIVYHGKKLFKPAYKEKLILYTEDMINYLDLLNGLWYSTDTSNKDYVEENSLIPTDISTYKIDYLYLLTKYKNSSSKKKKLNLKI